MTDPAVEIAPGRCQNHEVTYSRGSNDNLRRSVVALCYSTVSESSPTNQSIRKGGTTRRTGLSDSCNCKEEDPRNQYENRQSEQDPSKSQEEESSIHRMQCNKLS